MQRTEWIMLMEKYPAGLCVGGFVKAQIREACVQTDICSLAGKLRSQFMGQFNIKTIYKHQFNYIPERTTSPTEMAKDKSVKNSLDV